MSVAQNLLAGRILEERLFLHPQLRDNDREVLGMMIAAIDQSRSPKHQDFNRWDIEAAQPAKARVFAQQAKRRIENALRRMMRNEDDELKRLPGSILDNGRYSWDVLS